MNLDRYGDACRCLLRLRENLGKPVISDDAFIRSHLESIPEWQLHPGAVDPALIASLAQELGVGLRCEASRDYDHALACFRSGNEILIRATPTGAQAEDLADASYSLVVDMDEGHIETWEPDSDGYAQTQNHAQNSYWDDHKEALVLFTRPLPADTVH